MSYVQGIRDATREPPLAVTFNRPRAILVVAVSPSGRPKTFWTEFEPALAWAKVGAV